LARTVVEAARRAGQRVLLLSGWGAFDPDSVRGDDVLVVDRLPHDWLLPRVRAFVHHGGVGSSAAAYRAGVPQVVVPFCLDQPFWGYRAVTLGVAPASIPIQDLQVDSLARGIANAVEDPRYGIRAQELAGSIAHDDGIRTGAEFLIDHLLGSRAAA
jgi:sterol 3beta-glucosyltransferase